LPRKNPPDLSVGRMSKLGKPYSRKQLDTGEKQHITKVLTGQWTVAQAEKHINKRASKDQE